MKLSGIRVLDFSRFMAGPLVSSIMADHGADVVKIEPPEGDPTRKGRRTRLQQPAGDSFCVLNRGKRSVVLDLKQSVDRARAHALIHDADVLIESFSPGVTARLGIDAPTAHALNPRLVYCSISAFGQNGPLRDAAGHDPAVQALAGILSRDQGGAPIVPAVSVASWGSALAALAGVTMALFSARETGRGDHLDLSMHDVALSARPGAIFDALEHDVASLEAPCGHAILEPYETADGRWLCVGAGEPRFARALLDALGGLDLIDMALGLPGAVQDPLRGFLASAFLQKTLDTWLAWMSARAISCVPVLDYAQALKHPHTSAREMLIADSLGEHHLNTPIRFVYEPGRPNLHAPELGEHTDAVLSAGRVAH
ncbi:CaiB/BaiF CoA transferase family protein [Paraburkholderia nodosa]|uniref:CaiB/BaiF CoA transferase family protein n=1 Tax=Paraburkholderia nodosa TaxID=392320 RepID=UPI0004883585|nr:CoA transferase [Paraburkholderia nodosa]